MDILKISAVAITTAFCALFLRETRSDIALVITLAGGVIILLMVAEALSDVFAIFRYMTERTGASQSFVFVILKIVGIGLIVDFSAGICEDAGSKGLAERVVLAGKLAIMLVAMPVVTALFELIVSLV